jgi:HlyD family secretion protein
VSAVTDGPPGDEAANKLGPKRRRPRPILTAVGGVVLLGVAALGLNWWLHGQSAAAGRIVGSSSIEATTVDVTTRVPGTVLRLMAREGQSVRAGSFLAELEPQEAGAQVAQARAAVAQAAAQVRQAQQVVVAQQQATDAGVGQATAQVAAAGTGIPQSEMALAIEDRTSRDAVAAAEARLRAAEAQVGSTRSGLATAERDLTRQKALFAQGAVAADQVDATQAAYDAAVSQDRGTGEAVTQARADLAAARANLMQVQIQRRAVEAAQANVARAQAALANAESGYTVVAQQRQLLAAAEAALAQARANLEYVRLVAGHDTIVAPRDGVIQTKNVEEGEVVPAGAALYTLINPTDLWARVYVREDQIGLVKIGQPTRTTIDTLPGDVFTGRVTQVNDAPEFTTVNVQTKEDRVKLVFGVKVRIADPGHRLQPGMPAHLEILTNGPQQDGEVTP